VFCGDAGGVWYLEQVAQRKCRLGLRVADAREVIAAVGMTADSSVIALEELADALGPLLRAGADWISARLGYRRDDEIPGAR
jgi:DNA-binding IclR family transcriptional regulator